MSEMTIGTGRNFAELGNAISDAMHNALTRGMEIDEAACCAIAGIADYARGEYGDDYLPALASIVTARAGHPIIPDPVTE